MGKRQKLNLQGCLLKLALFVLVIFIAVAIGGYFWTKSYIRSSEFEQIVQHQLSKRLGGQVKVAPTEWDGWKLENEKLEVLAGKGFQDLEVSRVALQLEPRGLFKQIWHVSDVHLRELSVNLGRQTPEEAQQAAAMVPEELPVTFDWKDIGKAWLPRTVQVDTIGIEQCHGSIESGDKGMFWKNAEVQLEEENGDYRLQVPRGQVYLNALPALAWEIQQLTGRIKADSFYINNAELKGADRALLTFTGEGNYAGEGTIQGELKDFMLSEVLESNWQKRVVGELQAEYTAELTGGNLSADGHGSVQHGMITALPALDTLAKQTGISRFRQIMLDICEFDFQVRGERATLRNIELESERLLRVTGEVTHNGATANTGHGTLQIGLSDDIIDKMPSGTLEVFNEQKDEHHWTTVRVKLVDGNWEEDLSGRLIAAVARAFITNAPQQAADLVKGLSGILNSESSEEGADAEGDSTSEGIKRATEGTIDKGKDILETGVKSLFDLLGR